MGESFAGRGQARWLGPQAGETASAVRAINEVVARSGQASVSVVELRRFSDGCIVQVEAAATSSAGPAGEALRAGMAMSGDVAGPPPAVLRFGVQLDGGATASTLDHVIAPAAEPEPPYFSVLGGPGFDIEGNRLSTRQELWLWPAYDEFGLVVEWPLFEISSTRISLSFDQGIR
ncbi:hypothetical protein [Amycolatopsis sp. NPDC051371]|uniref:hypothetical protein n=1 Tax=Amycolatopsis sp. NPDC051371 TaxID=3155800 RepID=UPI00342D7EDE